jgi:hypothetical protein
MDDKVVQIRLDASGMPVPDQDPVVVKKSNQKVRWSAPFEFRIIVDGYDKLTHSNGGDKFLCMTDLFDDERSYKYTISANGVDNDPTLDIKP